MVKKTGKKISNNISMNIMRELRKESNLVIILLIISFFLLFFKLGAPSFFETDEVIYSQIAREIIRTGDWITLHFQGQKWFIHPPLYMWLISISSLIFGQNEFNSRLWCALFGVGLVFITYLLGKKMFRDGVGILAGFILATSFQFIIQSRIAIFDVPLAFFIMLSIYFFFSWQRVKDKKYYYMFFGSMGLATLMKGPVGIVIPIMVLIPYLFIIKDIKSLFNKNIFLGSLIWFVLGGTWYAIEAILHGRLFIDSVLGFYIIQRYLGPIEAHSGPWFYYLPIIIIGLLPWTIFLPFSLAYQSENKGDENNLFVVLWISIVFVFFSLAGTKLPGYILSMYPMLSISIAKMLADYAAGENSGIDVKVRWTYKCLMIISIIIAVIGMLFSAVEVQNNFKATFFDIGTMFIILGAGGVISSILFFKSEKIYNSIIALVVTMIVFTFYTSSYTMPHLDKHKPMKAISKSILSVYKNGDKIINYKYAGYKNSYVFYLDKPVIWIDNESQLMRDISADRRIFLIAKKEDYYNVIERSARFPYLIYQSSDVMLLSNRK